jgi:hypothetical protein
MVWLTTDEDEGGAVQELYTLPDRAAAIVAVALLDRRLEIALKQVLRDGERRKGETVYERMFRPSGPIGAFSTKISLGYMIGLRIPRDREHGFHGMVNTDSTAT